MTTLYPAGFDPHSQTYLDYINSLTGYNPNSSYGQFPGQSQGQPQLPNLPEGNHPFDFPSDGSPNAQNAYPGYHTGPTVQPTQSPAATAAQTAIGVKGAHDIYQQAQAWANPISSSSPVPPVGAPPLSSPVPGPISSPIGSNYPATESLIQGNPQNAIASSMSAAPQGSSLGSTASGLWGSGGSTQAGQGIMGMSGASPLLGSAGIAAGAWTGQQQGQGLYDAAHGKDLSFTQQAALALPTFGASLVYNPIKNWGEDLGLWSWGNKDHKNRTAARGDAIEAGWLDKNKQAKLSDGTILDFSQDGHNGTLTNAAGQNRHPYDIDQTDPLAAQGTGWLQPLGAVLGKGDPKLTSDFTGYLYNSITKDGKITDLATLRQRVIEAYNAFKLKPSIVSQAVEAMGLDPKVKDAYLAAIDNLKPGKAPQLKPGQSVADAMPEKPSMNAAATAASQPVPKPPQSGPVKPMGTGAVKPLIR